MPQKRQVQFLSSDSQIEELRGNIGQTRSFHEKSDFLLLFFELIVVGPVSGLSLSTNSLGR